ncbi:MAG TPA: Rossmann-like and DUF2520 domain-containing protein [Phycisphaerae bacterium]|nr:Rossmann-like and DUF2520 domain-containing protein [Phycisphaerae bacterium]
MPETPDISIIGPGKVGTAIGTLAARAGRAVVAVGGGGPGKAEAAARAIGPGVRACSPADAARAGRLVLLTVPDGAIGAVCEELAAAGAFSPGAVVAHCSGALPGEVLAAARDRCGCEVGSMHPLQTFPTVEAATAHLPGAYCFCEGDEPAVAALEELAGAIGCIAARIDPAGKALYHAAAIVACNYFVALQDMAAELAEAAGVAPAVWHEAVGPMLQAAAENAARLGPAEALTGPIVRGDAATVARHVEALTGRAELLRAAYEVLGRRTVELARRTGRLDPAGAERVLHELNHLSKKG